MNREIFEKYLQNNCSEEEFENFVFWVKEQSWKVDGIEWISNHWKKFEPELQVQNEIKFSRLLDKIHHKINLNKKKSFESKVITLAKISKWLNRVAAILFIPLLGLTIYLNSKNSLIMEQYTDLAIDSVEVIAPIGSRTVVQLSDGTEVHLNYGSKIKYPRNFNGDTREVLLSGECYFDVAHDPSKPFIVKTEKLNIKALGTEFNVLAYPEDDFIATTLVKGKVVIEKKLQKENVKYIGEMIPEQHVRYNLNSNLMTSSKGNIDKYIAWKDGRMVFDNAPIEKVVRELSRKFNVDIEVAEEIKEISYTVTFTDDPLFLILDLMTETTPIVYKRFPRMKLPDGTFSKLKIKIEKRV